LSSPGQVLRFSRVAEHFCFKTLTRVRIQLGALSWPIFRQLSPSYPRLNMMPDGIRVFCAHKKDGHMFNKGSKMKKMSWLLLFLNTVLSSQVYASSHGYAIDYIQGEGDVTGVKLAYQWHTDWLKQYSDKLELYFESSVNFWEYGQQNKHDSNFVLAISPVIQYPVGRFYTYPLYIEFGIGFSLLDDTKFAGKDVSTHYQFEDRLGLVTRFGDNLKHSVALRYLHYSNAGFKSPNPGLDFVSLSYSKRY